MTESIEDYQSIAKREYNKSLSDADIQIIEIGGKKYALDYETGLFFRYDEGRKDWVQITYEEILPIIETADEKLLSVIKAKIENKQIVEARNKMAEILADKDPILLEILKWHINENEGKIQKPLRRNGIDFYSVGRPIHHSIAHGREISRQFYAGTKDGKKYILSILPDCKSNENGEFVTLKAEEHIREVHGWALVLTPFVFYRVFLIPEKW